MAHFVDASGSLSNARRTPQGGFVVDATLARVGVLKYWGPTGEMRSEFNPPNVLQDALASVPTAPVTYKHPKKFVDVHNYQQLAAGHVIGNPEFDGTHLKATLAIQDAALIRAIELGEAREVSIGYMAEREDADGESEGERYSYVRTKIELNHIAVVPSGRAGKTVRLMLDSEDIPETQMLKINDQEIEFETAQAAFDAYDASLQAAKALLESQLADAQAKLDALQADLAVALSDEAIDARIAAKAEAQRVADEAAAKMARIVKAFPGISLEGRSQDFIDGLAAALPAVVEAPVVDAEQLSKITAPVVVLDAKPAVKPMSSYEKMRKANYEASRAKLKATPGV